MKISYDWLSEFIEWTEKDPQVIADRLTRAVGEVEEIIVQGTGLEHVVAGKILTLEKHPNADKLSLCTVETEQGKKRVVCGGTNLRLDMPVAFAHIGAKLTSAAKGGAPVTINRVSIRGIESEGMICAAEEVGLTETFPPKPEDGNRPVLDLTALSPSIGTPLSEAAGLNDIVFHIDNHAITHRPDLFSHIGFARELVALRLGKWKKQPAKKKVTFLKTPLPFPCTNDAPDLIKRYCGCTLTIEGIGETPAWMKRRLTAVGLRSISLPVDITNYVMLECGTPIHSFDVAGFRGAIHMRTAQRGEKITTLDGVERTLPDGAAIMSDDESVFDLLGIMGGLRGSTTNVTKNIYLHSAVIDGVTIRKTIVAIGHRTDAATLSEKGVPPIAAEEGFFRALELFLAHAPGARITSRLESTGTNGKPKTVSFPTEAVASLIGSPVTPAKAKKILTDLGYKAVVRGKTIAVTPPLWRPDTKIAEDVIEEVARISGYANVSPVMPEADITPPARDRRINEMRDSFKESGYFELLHVAFTSPQLLAKMSVGKHAVRVENPIGEEISLMRPSLLPAMMVTTARELKAFSGTHLKTYEVGHAFSTGEEWNEFTLLVAARSETTLKEDPFLILKADVLRALKAAGHIAVVRATKTVHTLGHPGRSAEIVLGEKRIGLLFEVHPHIRAAVELPARAAACVIDADILLSLTSETAIASPLPAFPSVVFDETIPLTTSMQHGSLIRSLKNTDPLLRSIAVIDIFERGETKTLTLRFTYRADDRTLTQQEVENVHARILASMANAGR